MGNGVATEHGESGAALRLRERLTAAGTSRQWPSGHRLVREGERAGAVHLIEQGTLKVTTCTPEGDEAIHAILGPGDLVGELAALDGRPHAADVVALSPGTGRRVPATEFRAILTTDVEVAMAIATVLADRIRAADQVRIDSISGDVGARVARRLWHLSGAHDPDAAGEIRLRMNQDDLARWCGASRQAVNGALAQLRAAGVLRTARGSVVVLDRDGLLRSHLGAGG